MKITIYELLGLVKDGKAPKKIKYGNIKLEYDEDFTDYYKYCDKGFFEYKFTTCNDFLNEKVEIIEESKKIEKMECDVESWFTPSQADIEIIKKVNELIDEINKLNEK